MSKKIVNIKNKNFKCDLGLIIKISFKICKNKQKSHILF